MNRPALALVVCLGAAPAAGADERTARVLDKISAERIGRNIETLAGFGTRNTLSATDDAKRGIGAARRWIKDEMERAAKDSGGRLKVEFDAFTTPAGPRVPKPTEVVNVLAWLEGKDPASRNRIYVVSGHYDSRASDTLDVTSDAPGANDDGSGTALVLELARVLAGEDLDATIVFAAVAGEEQGLLGAEHLAARLKAEGKDVAGMFTNDIVGSSRGADGTLDGTRVRLFSEGLPAAADEAEFKTLMGVGGENDSPSRNLARFVKAVAEQVETTFSVDLVFRRDRYLRGGDHIAFNKLGYAAVRFTEPNENYAHQHQDVRVENGVRYGDLPEFVDVAYVARVARVNAAALIALASAPAPPRNVTVDTKALTSDTTLSWDKGVEADLAGYRIHVRATTAPLWEKSYDVGLVTTYTFKGLSKDNAIFGAASVDNDGHASPAVFPRPSK